MSVNLSEEQRRPVEDTDGAVLVFAGAGSGKTRVLTERIAYLVNNKCVDPRHILAITFTNKAADEMKERLSRLVLNHYDMWICTIHSMCTRILRGYPERLGYGRNFSIYTTTDKERVLKRICDELRIDDENVKKNAGWYISDSKNYNLSPDEYEEKNFFNPRIKQVAKVFKRYEEELFRCNAVDFDDLLTKTLELLENHPDAREYYQQRFRYVHIDEFQDTNKVQYKILKILAAAHGNIFAVGDDDQSIYGWRGADINNILNFGKDFPSVKIYKLEQNYRSTKNILDAANKIIGKNAKRFPKNLYTQNNEGVRVESYAAFDEIQEASYVVGLINTLTRQYGFRHKDIAILMRVNALSRIYEQEMRKYNIPYMVFGGFKFFERKEIKDLIAYLRAIQNPRDDEAILRIINTPKRGIGDTAVTALRTESMKRGQSLSDTVMGIENIEALVKIKGKISEFRDLLKQLIFFSEQMPIDEFVKELIDRINYRAQFAEKTEEDLSRLFNIDEFIVSVKEFSDVNPGASLDDYLTSISLSSDLDDANETDYVSIATVHSAKGLEFGVVFIVGLDEKIFPIVRDNDESDMEEERRLMYVAITRAKERLYLTRAKSRFIFGERNYTMPSRFFNDLFPVKREITTESGARLVLENVVPPKPESRPPVDYDAFKENITVFHKVFGEGIILNAKGEGEEKTVEVLFKGAGKKNLALQFAPLNIVKRD